MNAEVREFIVITNNGQTFDDEGFEVENSQVLDYIEAKNLQEAKAIIKSNIKANQYGAFKEYEIFERVKN